jgi:multiple sugar transport system permease protein
MSRGHPRFTPYGRGTAYALLCVSLAVAYALSRGVRGSRFLRALYVLPVVTPAMVVGIMWRWIFNEDAGILNGTLEAATLDGAIKN